MSESRIEKLEQRLAAKKARGEFLAMLKQYDDSLLRRRGVPLPSEQFMENVDIPGTIELWRAKTAKIGLVMNDGILLPWMNVLEMDKNGPATELVNR